jgi:membrane peptidoglycan carboxypeptidase
VQLSPREAAQLAAVLPNPIKFKPTSTVRYVARRSRLIYAIMARQGLVAPERDSMAERVPHAAALVLDTGAVAQEPLPDTAESIDIDEMLDSLAK